MATFLLEIFSEEIPARMQARGIADLERRVKELLEQSELTFDAIGSDVTPRRMIVRVEGLPTSQPDTVTERKGPRVGAPEKAMQGFLKSVDRTIDQLEKRETPKGEFYFVRIERQGRPTREVLAEGVTEILATTTWPKSMRWGDLDVRWVRPMHSIIALLDDEVVPVTFGPITAGRTTRGHRFLANDEFEVSTATDYDTALAERFVVADAAARAASIREGALAVAQREGMEWVEDLGLLNEVAGLVEYPVVLAGEIDESFMDVPAEILMTAMRTHQKYFSFRTPSGELAPRFLVVANMKATDGGAQIVAGNERVLRARLSDAKFFWDTDQKATLESRLPALEEIVFQAQFGDGADRLSHKVARIEAVAAKLAEFTGAERDEATRAARLCKADLVSSVVYEFPELQGTIGRYYAENDGESPEVAAAIAEHYSPAGPNDACPAAPVSVTVALADKLDTLVGFFAIDQKPTGSKDPFALRRAALGVLRLLLENEVRLSLRESFAAALEAYPASVARPDGLSEELLGFFADRLEVHLRDHGVRHDFVRAVFAGGEDDDVVRLVRKARALEAFLAGEDGANLLAGYRRASNIVRIEEKKDGVSYSGAPDPSLLTEEAEVELDARLRGAHAEIEAALAAEDFEAAMAGLASLRTPIDQFFESVTVNADEPDVRANRLRLLAAIRSGLGSVADFSKIEG